MTVSPLQHGIYTLGFRLPLSDNDLYGDQYRGKYDNYMMGGFGAGNVSTIPAVDAEYLKQVYRKDDYK